MALDTQALFLGSLRITSLTSLPVKFNRKMINFKLFCDSFTYFSIFRAKHSGSFLKFRFLTKLKKSIRVTKYSSGPSKVCGCLLQTLLGPLEYFVSFIMMSFLVLKIFVK